MAGKKKDLATREETAVTQVQAAPAWLVAAAEGDTSKDALREHLVLPMLRIVPQQPGERMRQYKDQYGEGALVITPGGAAVAPADTWVKVVPLFMFTEFRKWHDRDDTGSDAVLARDYDPTSELGRKARDENARQEVYGDPNRMVSGKPAPFMYQYVEHLCFTVLIYEGDSAGMPAVLEFQRGSLWKGKEFSSGALMRQVGGVSNPLWSQVWEIQTRLVTRKGYTWWALEFRNPDDGQLLITDDQAEQFQKQFTLHREAHASRTLTVDLSEADDAEAVGVEADVLEGDDDM